MVLYLMIQNAPLLSAAWVFAGVIALTNGAVTIFIHLRAGVLKAKRIDVYAAGYVGYDVLVMHDPPVLRPDSLHELREFLSAHSRLAKVVHLSFYAVLD
jgi:hypothetical protein